MRRIAWTATVLLTAALLAPVVASALDITQSVEQSVQQGVKEFVTGVAEQWKQSPESVETLKKLGIKEEELPLLMMIAERAGKTPEEIAKQRKSGKSWNTIMTTNKVPPETVYAPATGPVGPPYGNAYGYFRNRQQKDWKNIRLSDDEAVGLANIKYLSTREQVPPDEIIRRKGQAKEKSFAAVQGEIKKEKQAKAKATTRPVPPGQQRVQGQQGQGNGNAGGQGRGNSGNQGATTSGGGGQGRGKGQGGQGGGQGNSGGNGNGRGPK